MKRDLSRTEQSIVLERLAVFRSGFLLAAAKTVCSDDSLSDVQIEAAVEALAEDGVLEKRRLGTGTVRYSWPERSGDLSFDPEDPEGRRLSRRHADWTLRYMLETRGRLGGEDEEAVLEEIEADRPNIDAALKWATDQNVDPELSLRLAIACFRYWYVRGHYQEGADYILQAISRVPHRQDPLKLRALNDAGTLLEAIGDYRRALGALDTALKLSRALGESGAEAAVLSNLGVAQLHVADIGAALANLDRAVSMAREVKDEAKLAATLINLAEARIASGELAGVEVMLKEADELCYRLGDHFRRVYVHFQRAELRRKEGDIPAAKDSHRRSLEEALGLGDIRAITFGFRALGELATETHEYLRAARLFGAAEAARDKSKVPIPPAEMNDAVVRVSEAKSAVPEADFIAAWEEGRTRPLAESVRFAIS